MPANKPHQDREGKRDELIAAARHLFVQDGYDATSMAALARAAGVSPNTLYWYFANKDDLLIAVLDTVLVEALADHQSIAAQPLRQQLLWTVEQLQQMRHLVTTVHARIGESAALHTWHENFHAATEGLLRAALQQRLPAPAIDAEVKIAAFAVEGLLTHQLDAEQQRAICRQLAARWD